jgi:hypothetical protein
MRFLWFTNTIVLLYLILKVCACPSQNTVVTRSGAREVLNVPYGHETVLLSDSQSRFLTLSTLTLIKNSNGNCVYTLRQLIQSHLVNLNYTNLMNWAEA